MKKIVIALLFVLLFASTSYAENFLEYKRVLLCANHRIVLVNRWTGQVTYVRYLDGKWGLLMGVEKRQYQSMYEAQVQLKLKCN
jgi:hypothetical protein